MISILASLFLEHTVCFKNQFTSSPAYRLIALFLTHHEILKNV